MRKIIFISLLLMLNSCLSNLRYYKANYDIDLVEVEKNSLIEKQYEIGVNEYKYEDDLINIIWQPNNETFDFQIYNKSKNTLKILWDKSVFVDSNSISHKIRSENQSDSNCLSDELSIVRKTYYNDKIYPCDYKYQTNFGWKIDNILPNKFSAYSQNKVLRVERNLRDKFFNKKFQILLTVKNNNIIKEYIFIFKINNIYIQKRY